jgi:endonuclease-3
MSSSTSDTNLANIVPRLFTAGLTSARGVVEIVQQYGVDSLCSLMSESGRFYQNTERILNAADYFLQQYHGTVPVDVTITELCTLLGVGYKTANIVVTTAFKRIEGIPSDLHVIRWSALLGWTTSRSLNGLECSKQLEQWLPKSSWGTINPLFGSLGQLITGSTTRKELFSVVAASNDRHIVQLFDHAYIEYTKKKVRK